jgi:hypothetical protein
MVKIRVHRTLITNVLEIPSLEVEVFVVPAQCSSVAYCDKGDKIPAVEI